MASHGHLGPSPASSYSSNGGDWSPRISFSHSFTACSIDSVPRRPPPLNAVHNQDADFEFSSFLGTDLYRGEGNMVSADELFCDGKLRPFERSSDQLGFTDNRMPAENGGEAKTCRDDKIGCISNEDRTLAGRELWKTAENEGRRRGMKAPKSGVVGMSTSREELITSVCRRPEKLEEMGRKEENPKLPTSRGDMSACSGVTSEERAMPTSRDGPIQARIMVEKVGMDAQKARLVVSREDLMSACKDVGYGNDKGGREEMGGQKEERRVLEQMRRFSRNPRSVSMTMDGSSSWYRPANSNRSCCVSLNNSRCPSPTRSFSVPSTRPGSPTASSSISAFPSLSSSSSKYTTRLKDFFKLRKSALVKEGATLEGSSSSTCRLPTISPKSFWPFSKQKGTTSGNSKSFMSAQQAGEDAIKDEHRQSKVKDFPALPRGLVSKDPTSMVFMPSTSATTSVPVFHTVQVSGNPTSQSRTKLPCSLQQARKCSQDELPATTLVIDDRFLDNNNMDGMCSMEGHAPVLMRARRFESRGSIMVMGSGGGGGVGRQSKGLERPIAYVASSVRVTPVLNVPGCITPSVRKSKPSARAKTFSFDSLFSRRERI